ncbi:MULTISPECIES: SAM-dependent methyltransferase [Halomonadaceae]|uniref:Methyltransferase domain-containing protein n=1 Tax=Vreelandella halophila TaxID=86177 RepID=A0A9X4YCT7_9GAMM|nr:MULTISPECIES: cyclopropane-fatty-acyl-phospholipid synthase family protein [Halomonas]MYL26753.1 methyltransferase domain-containing protein [Halomonas utahensis]MYL75570.1 methyltransferase domain-containing protein [Halomonas sp. 22501_18_FS]
MENLKITAPRSSLAPVDHWARVLVTATLRNLEQGQLRVVEGDRESWFGSDDGLHHPVQLTVHDASAWRDMVSGGSIGAAEAYVAGDWDSPDLTGLLRFFARNNDRMNGFEDRVSWVTRPARRSLHWLNRNTRTGARKNIEAHYDLGNDLFERFLDPTMMYSAAIFPSAESTLEEASRYKLDRICQKLDLRPGDQVVEIGTGWGGFALHAAQHYGCHVTTTTISAQQYEWAREQIAAQGLDNRITLLYEDYRNLEGTYDKLVSIEMIEAVGPQFLGEYMEQLSALLKPDGLALIQAITLPEQRYERALKNVDFIQRYIFPGSFIPSLGAILGAVRDHSDLVFSHAEDIGLHYARTLACWRERFEANRDAIRSLGYSDAFIRLWRYYFAYCEAGFAERRIGNIQLLMGKPDNRRSCIVAAGDLTDGRT